MRQSNPLTEPSLAVLESLEPRLLLSAEPTAVTATLLVSRPDLISLHYQIPQLTLEPYTADAGQVARQAVLGDAPLTSSTGGARLPTVPAQVVLPYGYDLAGVEVIGGEAAGAPAGPAPLGSGIVDPADSYDYVIITSQAIAEATTDYTLGDFMAHKQALGFDITLVTVEDIYAGYSGADQQEEIRNFIIDAYNDWEIDYVLLGGDPSVIPIREVHILEGDGSWFNPAVATDLYYQCLDGDFDHNENGLYGQRDDGIGGGDIDWYAEVYIGRAAFDNTDRMANWVYKTISYENTVDEAYRYNAEMVGEYIYMGGLADYAKPYLEEIRLGTSAHGYTTAGFAADPSFTVDTLYEQDGTWPVSELYGDMNSDQYGIFNALGHGAGGQVMKMTTAEVDTSLTNDKFFFIYSQACWAAYMYGDSIAEHLTTYTRHGAVALVFNSNWGWGANYSTDGVNQRLNRAFWHALFSEGINELGAMNAYSHEFWTIDNNPIAGDDCYDWTVMRVVTFGTNLFGDPSLQIVSFDLSIQTEADLPLAYQSEAYNLTLEARFAAEPVLWQIIDGALPDGLALDADTGVISGAPTTIEDAVFTVQITDSTLATATKVFNLSVIARLEITTGSELPAAYEGEPYSVFIQAAGGAGPYTFTLTDGALPTGLLLNGGTGEIAGATTELGAHAFTIEVSDTGANQQTTSQAFTLNVLNTPAEIRGQVFNDADGDGLRGAGELGLNGWTIELLETASQTVVATTVSASVDLNIDGTIDPATEVGLYAFTDVVPGDYQVRQVLSGGYEATTFWTPAGRTFAVHYIAGVATIYEFDPSDGTILNSFAAPEVPVSPGNQGLAVGPDSLFYADSSDFVSPFTLWELDLDTGAVLDSDAIDFAPFPLIMGLGFLNGRVYIQTFTNTITVWDPAADTIVETLTFAETVVGSLTGNPDLGLLYDSNAGGDILVIDPAAGTVIDTLWPGLGELKGGLAYHDGELLASPQDSGVVYRIDPATGALLGDLTLFGSSTMVALGGDAAGQTIAGCVAVTVSWGQTITNADLGNRWLGVAGDMNDDSQVNASDIDMLYDSFGAVGQVHLKYDLDNDGDADQDDVTTLLHDILNTEYGDANLDGLVNATDLGAMATSFGLTSMGWTDGDLNGDHIVNATDLGILSSTFGFQAGAQQPLGGPSQALSTGSALALESAPAPEQTATVAEAETPQPSAPRPSAPKGRLTAADAAFVAVAPQQAKLSSGDSEAAAVSPINPWRPARRPRGLALPAGGPVGGALSPFDQSHALRWASLRPIKAAPIAPGDRELDNGIVDVLAEVEVLIDPLA